MLLGLFADTTVNDEFDGLFYGGGFELLRDQAVAAIVVGLFSFAVTYAIAFGIQRTIGLRLDTNDEEIGLDQSQHTETAYTS